MTSLQKIFQPRLWRSICSKNGDFFTRIFWAYLILMGLVLVFFVPPFQKPDENYHYYHTYSLLLNTCSYSAPQSSMTLPQSLINFPDQLKINQINLGYQNKFAPALFFRNYTLEKTNFTQIFRPCIKFGSLAYWPSLIGVLLGGKNLLTSFYLARLMGLLFFLGTVFVSLKLAGRFKPLIMAIAIVPMLIHQVTAISYDSVHLSLGILVFASYVYLKNQTQNLSLKQLAGFLTLILGFVLAKRGYYFSLGLPLVLIWPSFKANGFKSSAQLKLLGLLIGFYFFSGFLATTSLTKLETIRTGAYNAEMQQAMLEAQPLKFFQIVTDTTTQKLSFYFMSLLGDFGYLDYQLNFGLGLGLMLITVWLIFQIEPKSTTTKFETVGELIVIGSFILGTYLLIALAMYLHASPIGAELIQGIQGRYVLIPYLFGLYLIVRVRESYSGPKIMKFLWVIILGLCLLNLVQGIYDRYYNPRQKINPYSIDITSQPREAQP